VPVILKVMTKIKTFTQRDLWFLLFLGISSGVPFLLILSTFSYWLNELNFSKGQVSLFTLISLPYSLKMLWAPYLEHLAPPLMFKKLGYKKGWGVLSQILLVCCITGMGLIPPDQYPILSVVMGILLCFFSATQDIIIDGLRIERFYDHTTGIAAAFSGIGFHLGKLAAGCGTLYLADCYNWQVAYGSMAMSILPGMLAMILFSSKMNEVLNREISFSPLKDAFSSLLQYKNLYTLVMFIIFFKIGDAILQGTSATFLYELGLSKIEFANLTKMYGTFWMIVGTFLGGAFIEILGIHATALISIILQILACLFFAFQAHIGYDTFFLSISIGFENFSSGVMVSALIAMISFYVQRPFTMSHYTLLYAVGSFSRVIFSAFSGFFAEKFGWVMLYSSVAIAILPTLYLIFKLKKSSTIESLKNGKN
jgi:PAT family beta-lactamase induction signal transducer AmpG